MRHKRNPHDSRISRKKSLPLPHEFIYDRICMLEILDLNVKKNISPEDIKNKKKKAGEDLFMLQKYLKGENIPVILVFEGLEAAGKGSIISNITRAMDPRGFRVIPVMAPDEKESNKPFLQRFWVDTPARGFIHIFDQSWYMHILEERVKKKAKKKEYLASRNEINQFERTLVDNGTSIIKFWLHISRKEQEKRLKKMQKSKEDRWRVTSDDWDKHEKYDKYIDAAEEMFRDTNTSWAPWHIVSTEDLDNGKITVMETVVSFMEGVVGKTFREKALESFQRSIGITGG